MSGSVTREIVNAAITACLDAHCDRKADVETCRLMAIDLRARLPDVHSIDVMSVPVIVGSPGRVLITVAITGAEDQIATNAALKC